MSDASFERREQAIRKKAKALRYPSTPDIASRAGVQSTKALPTARRMIGIAIVVAFVIVMGLVAVPQVRAAIVDMLRLGAVRIFISQSTPVPNTTATPVAQSIPTTSDLNLAGSITLTEAIDTAPFPLQWPTYPPNLGQPQAIFIEHLGAPVYVMVWMSPTDSDAPHLILYQMASNGLFLGKLRPPVVEEIEVNGQSAFWTTGPYMIQFFQQGQAIPGSERWVANHGLIWEMDGITYRLEGGFSRKTAVQIAESLRPF